MLIAYCSVSSASKEGYISFVMVTIVGVFLYLQNKYQPFIIQYANKCEEILLFCLILVIVCQGLSAMNESVKSYIISCLIFFPLILLIRYLFVLKTRKDKKLRMMIYVIRKL